VCVCVCVSFHLLNVLEHFYGTWYEGYATGGHPKFILSNFLSAITSWQTRELWGRRRQLPWLPPDMPLSISLCTSANTLALRVLWASAFSHLSKHWKLTGKQSSVQLHDNSNGCDCVSERINVGSSHVVRSRDSSVGIATGYGLDRRVGFRVPVGSRIFSTSSKPVLGPTRPPIQWVPGDLSPGESSWSVKLTAYLQLVPRSRKCGSIHPLLHTPSWHVA
jgi:hypothetical protein